MSKNNNMNPFDFNFETPTEMDLAKKIYTLAQRDILNVVLNDLEWQQKNKSNEDNQQKAVQLSINRVRQRLNQVLGKPMKKRKYQDHEDDREFNEDNYDFGNETSYETNGRSTRPYDISERQL